MRIARLRRVSCTEFATCMVTPFAVLVFGLVGCAQGTPDETSFAEIVADLAINDELVNSDRTVVLDSGSLSRLSNEVRRAVVQRLDESSLPWVQLELGEGWHQFPGTWQEGRGYRTNETHVLLNLQIDDVGRKRTVRWGHLCGASCGKGGESLLKWRDGQWIRRDVSTVRY